MSIELHIFVQNARVPTADIWQRAIDEAGFPTALDPSLDVQAHTGFSPTSYKGKSTGFEFFLTQASDILGAYPHIADKVGDREKCATFRWGVDFLEMCAALSAAASLAKVAEGIYFYPDEDIIFNADEALHATWGDLNLAPV